MVAASGTGSGGGNGSNSAENGVGDDVVGGCAAGGSGQGSLAIVMFAGLVCVRRRRR
jgi:uncharacterized protein (TIGR03382 family)